MCQVAGAKLRRRQLFCAVFRPAELAKRNLTVSFEWLPRAASFPIGLITCLLQELRGQATIAGPQYCNMVAQYTISLICIASVGRLSELDLAAASMSFSVYTILGNSIIISMIGALDTQASQVN